LVEQNSNLKREAAMTSRKLEARAERIHALEVLVQDSQERLERLQQKYSLLINSKKKIFFFF